MSQCGGWNLFTLLVNLWLKLNLEQLPLRDPILKPQQQASHVYVQIGEGLPCGYMEYNQRLGYELITESLGETYSL